MLDDGIIPDHVVWSALMAGAQGASARRVPELVRNVEEKRNQVYKRLDEAGLLAAAAAAPPSQQQQQQGQEEGMEAIIAGIEAAGDAAESSADSNASHGQLLRPVSLHR
jgi:hypothetical protein